MSRFDIGKDDMEICYSSDKFCDLVCHFRFLEKIDPDITNRLYNDDDESELEEIEIDFKKALATLDENDFHFPELYYQMAMHYKSSNRIDAFNLAVLALNKYVMLFSGRRESMGHVYSQIAQTGLKHINWLSTPSNSSYDTVFYMLQKAVDCDIEFLGSETHPLLLSRYREIVDLSMSLRRYAESLLTLQKIVKLDLCASKLIAFNLQIVDCYVHLNKEENAWQYCQKILTSYLMRFGSESKHVACIRLKILERKVKRQDADMLTHYESLINLLTCTLRLDDDDPLVIKAHLLRALIYYEVDFVYGQSHQRAISTFEKVLALQTKSLFYSNADLLDTHLMLAKNHDSFSAYTSALKHYQKADELLSLLDSKNVFPVTYEIKLMRYKTNVYVCDRLSNIYGIQGHFEKSNAYAKRAVKIRMTKFLGVPDSLRHLIGENSENKIIDQLENLLADASLSMQKTLGFVSLLDKDGITLVFLNELLNVLLDNNHTKSSECITCLNEIGILSKSSRTKLYHITHETVHRFLSQKKFLSRITDTDKARLMDAFKESFANSKTATADKQLTERFVFDCSFCCDGNTSLVIMDDIIKHYESKKNEKKVISLTKQKLMVLKDLNVSIANRNQQIFDLLKELGSYMMNVRYDYQRHWPGFDDQAIRNEGFDYLLNSIEQFKTMNRSCSELVDLYMKIGDEIGDHLRYDEQITMYNNALVLLQDLNDTQKIEACKTCIKSAESSKQWMMECDVAHNEQSSDSDSL